jgi:glycogen(starch) synthase
VRVAILSRAAHPLHSPGGLERAVYHLARHLQAQGVETVLLTRPATTGDPAFPGKVLTVPYGGAVGRHGGVLDRTLHYPLFSDRLGDVAADLVRSGQVDVVHAQGLAALGYGRRRRLDPALAAPLVMNPQGMEEHKTRGLKRLALTRLRALSREAARLSDRVVATDEATREEVPRLLGVDADRVVVLPNGIDPDEIRDATPADPGRIVHEALPELEGAYPVFLSVGRLERYKGFGDTQEGLRLAARDLPRSWAWVVVGEGPERERLAREAAHGHAVDALKRSAAGLPGTSAVTLFAGRVGEKLLHALYERADVFVHATRFEGSSLVTLEAMAHGLPVVATRAGGIPDKVTAESGRLVEPGDTTALARALLELAKDPKLRRTLGDAGRERALRSFAWPALAKRTIALYEELLRERRA